MIDPILFVTTLLFAIGVIVPEAQAIKRHAFADEMISHYFSWSVVQTLAFFIAAFGLIQSLRPALAVAGIALIFVPLTHLLNSERHKAISKLHVIAAGTAFGGVLVATYLAGLAWLALAYVLAVLVAYRWGAVVQEKVAAAACIVCLLVMAS